MKRIILLILVLLLVLGCGCTQQPVEPTFETEGTTDATVHSHTDGDGDGICDGCSVSVMTTFDVYSINDLHGKILDGDNHPGVDELTTFLKGVQQTDDNAIFISAGDMWQGAAESNLTGGVLVTEWMNDVGFTSMTLGNHDYDWGEDAVLANVDAAEFPFLAINIYDRETQTQVDYCQSSVVVDAGGIQVGIIGAIGDCYSSIASDKVEDIYFITGTNLTELVMEESEKLRNEGVDFIVYAIHDGYGDSYSDDVTDISGNKLRSYYDTALSDGYVDAVFEAHTHQQYLMQDEFGVYHMQNRGENRGGISHIEVEINTVTGSYAVTCAELIATSEYDTLDDDPIVEELVELHAEEIAPGMEVLGTNLMTRNSDVLRRQVAKLYYELGVETWGEEYDIMLGGGFITTRSPYNLAMGEVTYADLQSLFPFDNDIVLCSVQGSVLLQRFINTDNSNYAISFGDQSGDVASTIDPNGTYYIVVDTYTSGYSPNRLTVVEEYEPGVYARDLLAEFIKNGGYEKG